MAEPLSIESASTVFTYFNPTRSPYYTVGLATCVALFFACDVENNRLWLSLAVPAYLVAALTLFLSVDSGNNLTKEEHEDQLRFARSTSISVAVLALSFAGKDIAAPKEPNMLNFNINLTICCVQIFLFLLFNWALNRKDLPVADRNYVQITLLTSAFLADTSWNLAQATDESGVSAVHHQTTAYGLGALWVCCVLFWVATLVKLQVIQVQRVR